MQNLLEIRDLAVQFYSGSQAITAVSNVNLNIGLQETLVLAGESGSGKTIMAQSITRILPRSARIIKGSIKFLNKDLLQMKEADLVKIRGKEIAYIFQEPTSFLNPVYTVGQQIMEAIILHQKKNRKEAYQEAVQLLELVKIQQPERVMQAYAHQLSGGMNQRAFIAMALACTPELLIADEPTTSLDVTIESEILELLVELKKTLGFSLLFITHNLSIAKAIAERVCIMYKGVIVEDASTEKIFTSPEHAHTKELIRAYDRIGRI